MQTVSNIILLVVQLFIPIGLAALAGTISERSGVINLGLEGMMLFGSFGAVAVSYYTGNAFLGMLASVVIGGLIGAVHVLFCIKFRAHQSVIGVGINMAALGLTGVLLKILWGSEGQSPEVMSIGNWTIPGLNKIPVIGVLFDHQTPYLYLTLLLIIASWILMYKTKFGLRLRAIGDNPNAARTAGIEVNRYRWIALIVSGALAGLAGSYLSISNNNAFVYNMTAGRGFMGLAANIFGGWNPMGALGASLLFSTAQAVRFYLTELNIPDPIVQMLPYVVTIIALLFIGKKAKGPEALGEI